MKVRIKFAKSGVMKFVGHLDVMRYFQKLIRRSDIDIAYSEGFSPHQIMSFAAPLGVGLTSDAEYLDIEVRSVKSSKESVEAMNVHGVDGIRILSYRQLPDGAKNAMSIVAAADYRVMFREGYAPEGWQEKMVRFLESPSIVIVKKTKKSEREMDLKPLIYAWKVEEDAVYMRLCTGSTDNVKPELVMEAFYRSLGLEMEEFALLVHRLEIYAQAVDEELNGLHNIDDGIKNVLPQAKDFVSLEDLGEEI